MLTPQGGFCELDKPGYGVPWLKQVSLDQKLSGEYLKRKRRGRSMSGCLTYWLLGTIYVIFHLI